MKTKIDIISGFLGAGKTSLIKKLIDEKFHTKKIVIIENEFGEVGIDRSFLKKTNVEIKEINAGCICCTIIGDFKDSIKEIINKYQPERIIIEPSGVGKLSEIIGVIKSDELKRNIILNMVITVVDVTKYEKYILNFSEFYKNQIINANTIVLSRTQNISFEKLETVALKIRKLNERVNIITTPWDKLNGINIVEVGERDTKQSLYKKVNLIKRPELKSEFTMQNNNLGMVNADKMFNNWGIETPKIIKIEALKNIFTKLKECNLYGYVLRAKGIVQVSENHWVEFDYVPEEFELRNTTPDYTGRICVIGSNLKKDNLKNLFLI